MAKRDGLKEKNYILLTAALKKAAACNVQSLYFKLFDNRFQRNNRGWVYFFMTPANCCACSQKRFEIYSILIDRNPLADGRYGFDGAALNTYLEVNSRFGQES